MINSNDASSLGLHPIVYFYSKNGRYRTVSFLAVVDFIIELKHKKKLNDFIKVREKFERIILDYDDWVRKIYEKHRNNQKSYKKISKLFWEIINNLKTGKTIDDTIKVIISTNDFNYLTINTVNKSISTSQKDFNTNSKSEIYIKDTLPNTPRCKICNGFIHKNSISIDHKQRKQDGGLANVDNGQLTHPYCNTGYKN